MTRTLETDLDNLYERIVTEIAARSDTEPTELPPLFDAVDPDALTSIFAPTETEAARTGRIEFPYAGYEVTVVFEEETKLTIE